MKDKQGSNMNFAKWIATTLWWQFSILLHNTCIYIYCQLVLYTFIFTYFYFYIFFYFLLYFLFSKYGIEILLLTNRTRINILFTSPTLQYVKEVLANLNKVYYFIKWAKTSWTYSKYLTWLQFYYCISFILFPKKKSS